VNPQEKSARLPDVLVIDDNPAQLSARRQVLRHAGFSVLTAASAERALQLLRDRPSTGLKVILTDHVLPGANGDTFVRQLRLLKPTVPVLVISGMPEAEPQYAGLDIKFLHKPCDPEDLIAEVRTAMRSSHPLLDPGLKRAS